MAVRIVRMLAAVLILGGGFASAAGPEDDGDEEDTPTAQADSKAADGDYRGALASLESLIQSDSDDPAVWNLAGYAARKLGEVEAAERYYARALQIDPDHLGALAYQGELFAETGRRDDAIANLARLEALCETARRIRAPAASGNGSPSVHRDCDEYAELAAALRAGD